MNRLAHDSVPYGGQTIKFTLTRRERSTVEVAVEPDGTVTVIAPPDAGTEAISRVIRKRAAWILRQQSYFTQFIPRTPERRYLPGETHRYLGRQYRLKIVDAAADRVSLTRGFFIVHSRSPENSDTTRELLTRWYLEHARPKFHERITASLTRFPDPLAHTPRTLTVRELRGRWGSMSPNGALLLNRRLIEAPLPTIDYVIVHELCHRTEPHHNREFWELLDRVMPDWQSQKQRLERSMA